jgi:predicted dehydrogenase
MGIIGLGVMGRRMAAAVASHPAFRVVAGYDPNPPDDLIGIPLKNSAAAVINDASVHCVYIASPPATHAELVAAAAISGHAIFCEKPLTVSLAEAQTCINAVRATGAAAAVNFPFATAISALRLNKLVTGGDLGDIKSATVTLRFARWPRGWQASAGNWLAAPAQGGFVREVASHFLFLAHRMFGPGKLRQVSIERGPNRAETAVCATVAYQNVTLKLDAAVAGELEDYNRFEVIGTRSSAALTDWYRLEHEGALSDRPLPIPGQLDALASLLSGAATDHRLATLDEATAIVELVEAILETEPVVENKISRHQ